MPSLSKIRIGPVKLVPRKLELKVPVHTDLGQTHTILCLDVHLIVPSESLAIQLFSETISLASSDCPIGKFSPFLWIRNDLGRDRKDYRY